MTDWEIPGGGRRLIHHFAAIQSRVLINSNFITVTVEDQTEWSSIFGIIGGDHESPHHWLMESHLPGLMVSPELGMHPAGSFEVFLGVGAVILASTYGEGLASIFTACASSGDAF